MGGQESKPEDNNRSRNSNQNNGENNHYDEDQQYFIVEELNRVKLVNTYNDPVYFWIDPRIYNNENQKNKKIFQSSLTIELFTSIESLKNELEHYNINQIIKVISAASLQDENYKYMAQQRKIKEIYLFCQNQQRAKLLMSNFPKIKGVSYIPQDTLQQIKQSQQKILNKGPIFNSVLFMIQSDTSLLNKYRLNYYCLTNQSNKSQAKSQFVSLAKQLFPTQTQQINEFISSYQLGLSGQHRKKQVIEWCFKDGFYWSLVEGLPKSTTDPKQLAYLRTPVKDVYQTVMATYKDMTKRPAKLYIVVELNDQEKNKLAENKDNYMVFTTFVKGYTTEGKANQQFKKRGDKAFMFDVQISKKNKLYEALDFGFLIRDEKQSADVLFNIYNFFTISEITMAARKGTLIYGSLALTIMKRQDPSARSKMTDSQRDLLRNYDYLQDLMKKIKNQGSILQLSGYFKDSIVLYDRKLQQITRTNKPAAMLDEYRIEKGQSLKMNEQYVEAQNILNQVKTEKLRYVALIKIIEIYFIRQKFADINKLIEQLEPKIQKLKQWGFFQDYLKAKNYVGLNLMKKQKYREANKLYKALIGQTSEFYNFKSQGIPLVHDLYRNFAQSQTKINNFQAALNLLNSTKSWQQTCEGRVPNLILTEKLIQNVYSSRGDQQMVAESKQRIQKMIIDQSAVDINFIDASRGAAKIQQGFQQSVIAINVDYTDKKGVPEKNHIEQSAINFDSSSSVPKKTNIEQSSIAINLDDPKPVPKNIIEQSAITFDL